ncbi:MAG: ATPase [Gammaproteobacteria bacterium]
MKMNSREFRAWDRKAITLLGMSGVGKTTLARLIRKENWFHYSGDYRIGTRYLDEPILDNIKQQAMRVPVLQELLRSDSVHIANNLDIDNLTLLSIFLGKLGDPEAGGLDLGEFQRRQELHRKAEAATMLDVPEFIDKVHTVYGYEHFVNDAGGSLCEMDAEVIKVLAEHTLILYIQATEKDQRELLERAQQAPKPLYYRESFLHQELQVYMQENGLEYIAQINPDDFVRWVFPRLFRARLPRYEDIARDFGYTVTTKEIAAINNEPGFIDLVCRAIDRSSG